MKCNVTSDKLRLAFALGDQSYKNEFPRVLGYHLLPPLYNPMAKLKAEFFFFFLHYFSKEQVNLFQF